MPRFTDNMTGQSLEFAAIDELLEFANAVRKAGGGNTLPALLPAVPRKSNACLLARALNFDCYVRARPEWGRNPDGGWVWAMDTGDEDLNIQIAFNLTLTLTYDIGEWRYFIVLPQRIGNAAKAFDQEVPEFASVIEPIRGEENQWSL